MKKMLRHSLLLAGVAFLLGVDTKLSSQQLVNPGFESGNLTGWLSEPAPSGGSIAVVQSYAGNTAQGPLITYNAVEGSYFALLKTDGPGSYSRLSQTFSVAAGTKISGWAFFDAEDYVPYNDNAQVYIREGDANGTIVATVFNASVSTVGDYGQTPWTLWEYTFLSSGVYTVQARITNVGDASLDSYMGFDLKAGISGQKFEDLNANGVKDAGEPGLAGWTIKVSGDTTASTVTDGSGNYSFGIIQPGNYTVSEVLQPGWIQSYPTPIPPGVHKVKLDSGQAVANKDFGNYRLGSIGGKKFRDFNFNGVDDGEPGVPGWPIALTGPVTLSTATDGAGNYVFQNLPPGTYTVSEGVQLGWLQTFPGPPGTHTVLLTSGANVTDKNFGNALVGGGGGSISGMAFDDRNGNGVKDPGEPPIASRRIELSGRGVNKATLTDPNGEYTFTNVGSGSITVQQFLPSGWVQTIPAGGQPYTFTLTSGEGRSGVYFGSRIVTAVEDVVENPKDYTLFQNFPNPFNPSTRLSFYLPKDSYVTLKIFNVLGVEVAPLLEGRMPAGTHSVVWDAGDAPSGVYVYRLNAENFVAMKKMVLMK